MRNWRDCRGLFPRIVRCGCHWGWRWAQRLAARHVRAEIEEERMVALLAACVAAGGPVIGQEDEHCVFVIRAAGEESKP